MPKFRKRPIEIEAVQYGLAEYADNPWVIRGDVPQWLQDAARDGIVVPEFRSEDYWYLKIQTLEGDMYAAPDDWIIRGVKGELYPCKPDIFEATYESVPAPVTKMHIQFRPDPPHIAETIRDIRRNGPPPTRP
ncbi:hypothetical protein KVH15_33435 [Streptomyces olivaceus]|uniref:hypothetical protein n=1 Tax=Streptomyces olivaceus TaxID=47716 RepID=UPI001CCF8652|nr:hypothetical protein [Streptomyces olivaceus]MBZ6085888.1 hypothetical protein [Streptomyces olivaceus]